MNQVIELQSYNYVPIQQTYDRNAVLNKMVGTHFFGSIDGISLEELSEIFGSSVEIRHNKNGKGKLIVNFNNLDTLQGILDKIKS